MDKARILLGTSNEEKLLEIIKGFAFIAQNRIHTEHLKSYFQIKYQVKKKKKKVAFWGLECKKKKVTEFSKKAFTSNA